MKTNTFLVIIAMLSLFSCVTHQKKLVTKAIVNRKPIYNIAENIINDVNYFQLDGKLISMKDSLPVIFGTVAVYHNDKIIAGTETDFDGKYSIQLEMATPKILMIEFNYLNLNRLSIDDILAVDGKQITVDAALYPIKTNKLEPVFTKCNWQGIRHDDFTSGQIFTSEQIRRSGVRSN